MLKVLPQIVPFTFGEEEFNFDESVTAVCSITKGDLPLKIWWMLKGTDDLIPYNLTTSDGVVISRNSQKFSTLSIEAVKARHRGNYTCFAQNKAGVSQQSAYLSINGSTRKLLILKLSEIFAICFFTINLILSKKNCFYLFKFCHR